MSKQQVYNQFRQMFSKFIYEDFKYDVQSDGLHIAFCFRLVPSDVNQTTLSIAFRPTAFIPARSFLHTETLDTDMLDSLVFNIGMAELVSYWKCYCPQSVIIRPFLLNQEQIAFWKKLYFNGLGEFFYTNGISASIDDFMTVKSTGSRRTTPFRIPCPEQNVDNHSTIVPIGGGKDSVVTLELLGGIPLIMNPRGATISCVEKAGFSMDDVIVIRRDLDPLMLECNKRGALNGHTPFSAMLAFYTLLASALTGNHPDIALSNENSANESTVVGTSVNHQYSKSLEFENDFRSYVANNISSDFNYFSFLRPLSELQIAMLFSQLEKYHDVFRSCNVGSKQDIWCGKCAKCLFAFIILSPFIKPARLEAVFGKNMLDDTSLKVEFDQLTGKAATKPFECVGTVDEVNTALSMTISRWYNTGRPALLEDYVNSTPVTSLSALFSGHNVPTAFFNKLKTAVCDVVASQPLDKYESLHSMLDGKEILIAGFGREGQSTLQLLQRLYPRRHFDIAHNNDEILSLLRDNHYDLVIKSPGIPSYVFDGMLEREALSSQTDIFLQLWGHQTIGVSGTKGKSTTTSLIHKVLSDNPDHKVILAGNIGIPLFDIIPLLDSDTWVVAELSCHQLENIRKGPAIGLLLNLFEEHLDHYRDYADYCHAKMQMALRQSIGDVFFFCEDNNDLKNEVENASSDLKGMVIPYSLEEAKNVKFLKECDLPLLGDHNLCNIYAAWLVCQRLGVSSNSFVHSLRKFHPLEHRLELVDNIDGVTYYNDSISTIPQATIAAIEALGNVDTLILGGYNRGIDYHPLAFYLVNNRLGREVHTIVLLGSAGEAIYKALLDAEPDCDRVAYKKFGDKYDLENAMRHIVDKTRKGHVCLLSPAASSYDMYKNFEERGRDYKRIVNNMK